MLDEEQADPALPHFLVVKSTTHEPIKYSIFAIQKIIQCAVGTVKSAKKLRNGTVLLKVLTKAQAVSVMSNRLSLYPQSPPVVTTARSSDKGKQRVIGTQSVRDAAKGVCRTPSVIIPPIAPTAPAITPRSPKIARNDKYRRK
jgi:hypothetical protein